MFFCGIPPMETGFDKALTPDQMTPYWPPYYPLLTPLLTPHKINGKMNYQWDRFKFVNKFSLPETSKMADEGFVTENRAQNKLEYHQVWYMYPLEN